MNAIAIIGLIFTGLGLVGGAVGWGINLSAKLGRLVTLTEMIAEDHPKLRDQVVEHGNRLTALECRSNPSTQPRPSPV